MSELKQDLYWTLRNCKYPLLTSANLLSVLDLPIRFSTSKMGIEWVHETNWRNVYILFDRRSPEEDNFINVGQFRATAFKDDMLDEIAFFMSPHKTVIEEVIKELIRDCVFSEDSLSYIIAAIESERMGNGVNTPPWGVAKHLARTHAGSLGKRRPESGTLVQTAPVWWGLR